MSALEASTRAPSATSDSGRIRRRFATLASEGRAGLVAFVTAGDPDLATSRAILEGLPKSGADLVELGMPFTDPMADGPAIQASSLRALKAGTRLKDVLGLVGDFRRKDAETPVVLMGYYNPIYSYGVPHFLDEARAAGVDGLIVVDLPPEEDEELCLPAAAKGINFIRLATPTTDRRRLPQVLANSSGFLYYVSITGITGTRSAAVGRVAEAVRSLKQSTDLPIAVGFGIRTAAQAAEVARVADAAVVGSALVQRVAERLDPEGRPLGDCAGHVLELAEELAAAVRAARAG